LENGIPGCIRISSDSAPSSILSSNNIIFVVILFPWVSIFTALQIRSALLFKNVSKSDFIFVFFSSSSNASYHQSDSSFIGIK
jgi:hypothetical protein